jgi:hypothetical protein
MVAAGAENVFIKDVPDYAWHAGCFGTAAGNLMGFWDRNGMPGLYTGPTGDGLAPLNNFGSNIGIQSMWASEIGLDGRPAGQPGHIDDYWSTPYNPGAFESTGADPYVLAGREEHVPDCIGDFIGLSQNKWADLNGECSGNINGYAYVFWEPNGMARQNFEPKDPAGARIPDIPSGLRAWTQFRGYEADLTSQLSDTIAGMPEGRGFGLADLKAQINAGFPVILILQRSDETHRVLPGNPHANPSVHAMVAYGYFGDRVRYRTSWASGDFNFSAWDGSLWQADLPLRGVITVRPKPKITAIEREGSQLKISWHGPMATVMDGDSGNELKPHRYVVERCTDLDSGVFIAISEAVPELNASVPSDPSGQAFYRVRLESPETGVEGQ